MTNDYGNLELHKVLLSAMKDIDKICRENNINYYLFAGTLLGAINHKGFIPWDDDVDIVMLPEDFKKFYSIIENEYSEYYRLETFDNTENWMMMLSKLRILGTSIIINNKKAPIFIDICELHNMPDKKYQMFLQQKTIEYTNLCLHAIWGVITPKSLFGKLLLGFGVKLGKKRLGKIQKWALCKYDGRPTKYVAIMCNTLTPNPYTGRSGYITDRLDRDWVNNPTYIPFEDTQFMTYSHIEDYLDWHYTAKWREPYPEGKRSTKHNITTYIIEDWVKSRIGDN